MVALVPGEACVPKFHTVLCPIDFSGTSLHALRYANAIAASFDGRLDLLYVAPLVAEDVDPGVPVRYRIPRHEVVAEMRRALDTAALTTVRTCLSVEQGVVHRAIVHHGLDHGADVIVMGTHGRSGFSRLFLGSVTEKVMRTAPCPVLTVPPGAAKSPGLPVHFERVLCAVDYSSSSLQALRYALDIARQFNGQLSVLHVLEGMEEQDPCEHADAGVRAARLRILDDARGRLHYELFVNARPECEVQEIVAPEPHRPHREILRRAGEMPADLIVMGAQGAHGVELMLYGSNTHDVVRRATCPVLTIRG